MADAGRVPGFYSPSTPTPPKETRRRRAHTPHNLRHTRKRVRECSSRLTWLHSSRAQILFANELTVRARFRNGIFIFIFYSRKQICLANEQHSWTLMTPLRERDVLRVLRQNDRYYKQTETLEISNHNCMKSRVRLRRYNIMVCCVRWFSTVMVLNLVLQLDGLNIDWDRSWDIRKGAQAGEVNK